MDIHNYKKNLTLSQLEKVTGGETFIEMRSPSEPEGHNAMAKWQYYKLWFDKHSSDIGLAIGFSSLTAILAAAVVKSNDEKKPPS